MTSQGVGTAAAPLLVMVTSRETAGLPEARVFQVGVTVTRAEQEGEEAEVEEAEAEVEVEEENDGDDDDDGGAPLPPPLRFHDENLLAARVRPPPPPDDAALRPPEMSPGMSSVKGPGSEGAERRSGEACEEDKDAVAAALEEAAAADARATPATASSSTMAAPPARDDGEPFFPRLHPAERAMVGRSRGQRRGRK